jgi:hypothetical protein
MKSLWFVVVVVVILLFGLLCVWLAMTMCGVE